VFDAEVIELCIRWYATYRPSYRAQAREDEDTPLAVRVYSMLETARLNCSRRT
jgi:transposase-like protein